MELVMKLAHAILIIGFLGYIGFSLWLVSFLALKNLRALLWPIKHRKQPYLSTCDSEYLDTFEKSPSGQYRINAEAS